MEAWAEHTQFKLFRDRGDTEGMRRVLVFVLILALATSSGCMVLDEVDAAAAKMPGTKKADAKDDASDQEVSVTSAAARTKQALLEESKRWWDQATSLAPGDVESSIVRCQVRGEMQFMSKDDCLSRGGTPNPPRSRRGG